MNEDTEFEELGTRIWTDSEQLTEEDLEQYLALINKKNRRLSMRITIPHFNMQPQQPDPGDTFRAFNEEDLAPAAWRELEMMREQWNASHGPCPDCPGSSDSTCCDRLLAKDSSF